MDNQSNPPKAQDPPNPGRRLDNIAADVHHIIAAELATSSPSSILALAQSSQTLRHAALPFVYRDVVLAREEDEPTKKATYEALIAQFRDRGEYSIAHHVRHLVVKNEVPTDDLMMILDAISELGVLRKLSWENTAHVPPSVLDKLQKTWPDLELFVNVRGRGRAKHPDHKQMDERLLSSSLLRSLTYQVIYQGYQDNIPVSLEWAKLTRAISAGGNLRVLRIQIQAGGDEPQSESQLELSRALHLPALEEFSLQGTYYNNWNDEHCRMLANSVDMSKLHTLNIANGMPTSFFRAFTWRLPGIKTLRLEIRRQDDIGATAAFIRSVDGLEVLDIDAPPSVVDALWPVIVQHSATLKNLCLRAKVDIERLEQVTNSFSLIQRLGWRIPHKQRSEYLELMSRMTLERLELFMELPSTATDFCDELASGRRGGTISPSLDKERSQAAAVEIMQSLSAGKAQPLERLTMHLTRMSCDERLDPYKLWAKLQVRRDERSGMQDHFEFRGKQRWSFREGVEEELELEGPNVF
ncbi:hypothetical protein DE146DRAFT_748088 [Phaeosphaeria sp. MPI-PUGE-AT-0046c]|nr:hypothetical protein DE146DRAFT_748088 [Phaeosphaeria sp. MPI-PUGE-AT-0046c]